MTLKERCQEQVDRMQRRAIMRVGSPADDLLNFVVSEIGRAADSSLDAALPLCLYFSTDEDREEFIAAVRDAKPGMIARKWP